MLGFLKKIFDHEYKELKKFKLIADEVFELDDKYKKMTDKQLQGCTNKLKKRLKDGETVDDILPDAFAVCRRKFFKECCTLFEHVSFISYDNNLCFL